MRFLADENFDYTVRRRLLNRLPDVDILRIQETSVFRAADPEILEWAAKDNRIVLSHDFDTMIDFAWERVRLGKPMPGLIVVKNVLAVGQAIDDLAMMIGASDPSEFENQVRYIPIA
jgi:predicted nuclease of predicted toxin-antitoxin system